MATRNRTLSRTTSDALKLLGTQIRVSRTERRMSASDLAARVGISRETLRKIEQGDKGVEIGAVFEAAVVAGVNLFDAETGRLATGLARTEEKLALLPKAARVRRKEVKDDF